MRLGRNNRLPTLVVVVVVVTIAMLALPRTLAARRAGAQAGATAFVNVLGGTTTSSSSQRRSWGSVGAVAGDASRRRGPGAAGAWGLSPTALQATTIPGPSSSTTSRRPASTAAAPTAAADETDVATAAASEAGEKPVIIMQNDVPLYDHRATLQSVDGLPLVYEPSVIKRYWDKRPAEMQRRWALFLSVTAPFLTKLVRMFSQGTIMKNEAELARDLRIVLEKLGPTYVKLGQALSIRPDVVGPAATEELAKLQDAVPPFPNDVALRIIEEELGRPLSEVFSEISPDPIAAASLAQVYKARLASDGSYVAVKVQRPAMIETVSKDLYVMKRAVEVYQKYIVERFTAQTTDYQALLQVFATGFYEELDFSNEAKNQIRMKNMLADSPGIYIPHVYQEYSTRRLLVSEWVDGIKLTQAAPEDIRRLTKVAQECFLRQLLEFGLFHCDAHPGNLLLMSDTTKGELALLDFGLISEISPDDREIMVNALVHTANKQFSALIDDLVQLKVLPPDTDRAKVEPLMVKVISPYVFQGGGAKNLDIRSLSRDLTQATLEIPFSIPPYFALVARALGILEGIALSGDPDYRIVMESYPYVSRRLLTDNSPRLQKALNDILYGSAKGGERLSFRRLSALLAYAMDVKSSNGTANSVDTLFVDFDRMPSTALRLNDTLSFLLSENAGPLRSLLVSEVTNAGDLLLRQQFRRTAKMLPRPPLVPYPEAMVDSLAPPLTIEEEIFLGSLTELGYTVLGIDDMQAVGLQAGQLLRPDQVVAWLSQVNTDDALDVARLLQPGSPAGRQLTGFAQEVVRGLAERAAPRIERAVGALPFGAGASGSSSSSISDGGTVVPRRGDNKR